MINKIWYGGPARHAGLPAGQIFCLRGLAGIEADALIQTHKEWLSFWKRMEGEYTEIGQTNEKNRQIQ